MGQGFQEANGSPLNHMLGDAKEGEQKICNRLCSFDGGAGAEGGEVTVMAETSVF